MLWLNAMPHHKKNDLNFSGFPFAKQRGKKRINMENFYFLETEFEINGKLSLLLASARHENHDTMIPLIRRAPQPLTFNEPYYRNY